LGGLDIKKFQEEGEIIYLLKNAFVSSEFVIFEELWDAFPSVLLILKDILTSGYVRIGNESFKIKTKMIVACTNRGREEVVSDNSTEALMQRFLFEKEIVWTTHTSAEYRQALTKAVKNVNENAAKAVGKICGKVAEGEYIPSPRTAYKAYKSYVVNGAESLVGIYGFEKVIKKQQQEIAEQIAWDAVIDVYHNLKKLVKTDLSNVHSFWKVLKIYERVIETHTQLDKFKVSENRLDRFNDIKHTSRELVLDFYNQSFKTRLKAFNHKEGCKADKIQHAIFNLSMSDSFKCIKENVK